jgi:hypothetical protein
MNVIPGAGGGLDIAALLPLWLWLLNGARWDAWDQPVRHRRASSPLY